MRSARFGFREEPLKKEEPRASVMPSHLPSVDPSSLDGVREFAPDEKAIGKKETAS